MDREECKCFLRKIAKDTNANNISLQSFNLAFDRFDADNSGSIDRDEMFPFLEYLKRIERSKKMFDKLIDGIVDAVNNYDKHEHNDKQFKRQDNIHR